MTVERVQNLSRMATNEGHCENSSYFDGWEAYKRNPFHSTQNPDGVIQMGLAENKLCPDVIEWIKNHPEASICTPQGADKFERISNYQDYCGLPEFRQAMAKTMSTVRGGRVTFDPDRIVMAGGATGASEVIAFCLANPGDAFLVPTPYYPAFDRDLCWRTGAIIIPVHCYSSNNFKITREALQESYEKALAEGINVKGLVMANPSNPLGTILDRQTLKDLVSFTDEKNIHFVCDEIYGACVFDSPSFISISEIIQEMDCNRDLIHIIYGLSKDMGLPGLRVGIVYSYNDVVVRGGRRMSSFGLVSSQTQHFVASMLSDEDFMANFLRESSRRLKKRHDDLTKGLKKLRINFLESNAGLFVWMNLKHLLDEPTYEGEQKLWRGILNDVGLNITPGNSFHCPEPGWFRVCFGNMDDETMEMALKRIGLFVVGAGKKEEEEGIGNKWWKKENLRLKIPSSTLGYEKGMGSPLIKDVTTLAHSTLPSWGH